MYVTYVGFKSKLLILLRGIRKMFRTKINQLMVNEWLSCFFFVSGECESPGTVPPGFQHMLPLRNELFTRLVFLHARNRPNQQSKHIERRSIRRSLNCNGNQGSCRSGVHRFRGYRSGWSPSLRPNTFLSRFLVSVLLCTPANWIPSAISDSTCTAASTPILPLAF